MPKKSERLYERAIEVILTRHAGEIEEVLEWLNHSGANDPRETLLMEFKWMMPRLVRAVALLAMLPELEPHAAERLRTWGVREQDAEDVASMVADDVLRAVLGQMPRVHAGRWLSAVLRHALDRYRKQCRRRLPRDGRPIEELAIPTADVAEDMDFQAWIEKLPKKLRRFVKLLRAGHKIETVCKRLHVSAEEISAMVSSLQGPDRPGGSSLPLRKRSRRNR